MRSKFREANDTLDAAKARAEQATQLLEILKNEHSDAKSQSLIEMSKELQNDRLRKYQLKRESKEQQERIQYLARLIKNKDEANFKMETKAANFEGEMIRMKETYRDLDNERQKRFMRQRFEF